MRLSWIPALALAVLMSFAFAPGQAEANGENWAYPGGPKRWGYYPHYRHDPARHYAPDPYGYSYSPRGYYPYYNSGYWRSAKEMRARPKARYILPEYYQAWGYQDWRYKHRPYHIQRYGGHWIGHW